MVEVKDGLLKLEKDEAKYNAQTIARTIFCCYEGEKDAEDLINNPEKIEDLDYEEIFLSWKEIYKAKNLIVALVQIYMT